MENMIREYIELGKLPNEDKLKSPTYGRMQELKRKISDILFLEKIGEVKKSQNTT